MAVTVVLAATVTVHVTVLTELHPVQDVKRFPPAVEGAVRTTEVPAL